MVCVHYIDSKPDESEISCGSFRSIPKADRLPYCMGGLDGFGNSLQFGIDHPALSIPVLCEIPEIGTDHGNPLKLLGGVFQFSVGEIAVKPDVAGPLVEILRIRTGA